VNMFLYTLGWVCVIGVPVTLAFGGYVIATEGWNPVMLKLLWLPLVFLWGLRQVRIYRYQQTLRK